MTNSLINMSKGYGQFKIDSQVANKQNAEYHNSPHTCELKPQWDHHFWKARRKHIGKDIEKGNICIQLTGM